MARFRRAAALGRCAWEPVLNSEALNRDQLDFRNLRIRKLALLRARLLMARGQGGEAVEDLLAVASFGRHIGGSGVFIARLYECACESEAIAILAENLPKLPPALLDALPDRIVALPPTSTWAETMEAEARFVMGNAQAALDGLESPVSFDALAGEFFSKEEAEALIRATGGDLAPLLALVEDVPARLLELGEVLGLPRGRREAGLKAFVARVEPVNPIAAGVVDSAEGMGFATDRVAALWAMLRAAVVLIREGPGRFREVADPFGEGPFEYRPDHGGFELRSALAVEGKPPARLIVGGGDARTR